VAVKKELKNFQNTDGNQLAAPNRDCFSDKQSRRNENNPNLQTTLREQKEIDSNRYERKEPELDLRQERVP
jgi:hypothetical protein